MGEEENGLMNLLLRRMMGFLRSEEGPTATEYAAMLALFVVALLIMMGPLQDGWESVYMRIGTEVAGD